MDQKHRVCGIGGSGTIDSAGAGENQQPSGQVGRGILAGRWEKEESDLPILAVPGRLVRGTRRGTVQSAFLEIVDLTIVQSPNYDCYRDRPLRLSPDPRGCY
jgi:hypothetical protein